MKQILLRKLPPALRELIETSPLWPTAEELRLRTQGVCTLGGQGQEWVLPLRISPKEMESILLSLAGHSLYGIREELARGYFTAEGGLRVGVAGTAVVRGDKVCTVTGITSLAIRLPRDCRGAARRLLPFIVEEGQLLHTVILSPPQFGKTTLLRDVIRCLSGGEGCPPMKCAVVDERKELCGSGLFDLGPRTDVLAGCPKGEGVQMAVRVLSPQVVAVDEVGSGRELETLREAACSGVSLLCTAHGSSFEELKNRLFFCRLMEEGALQRVVLLTCQLGRGTVGQVYTREGQPLLRHPLPPGEGVC